MKVNIKLPPWQDKIFKELLKMHAEGKSLIINPDKIKQMSYREFKRKCWEHEQFFMSRKEK